jgi:hypothetical protein
MDFVFNNLEMDYWVVVVYLLGVHCINAGLAYQARKEVIDLESLVEANTDKPHIAETLISSYGTIEVFTRNMRRKYFSNSSSDIVLL